MTIEAAKAILIGHSNCCPGYSSAYGTSSLPFEIAGEMSVRPGGNDKGMLVRRELVFNAPLGWGHICPLGSRVGPQ